MRVSVVTAAERPDLWARADADDGGFGAVWPEYNHHGEAAERYFPVLLDRFPEFQVLLVEPGTERPVGRGRTIPFRWDGTLEDLPPGIDATGLRAIEAGVGPTALCALGAEVHPDLRGRGLSGRVLLAMVEVAKRAGLAPLLAPVRPSWKDRYPLIDIARYASWQREDGLPFDPWMRVHARLGAAIVRCEPHSMLIQAAVRDWETWTGMAFPDDGLYVFPEGLAPLTVDDGVGRYWEPNVWMRHHVT
jgi:GNAT superfamily N-acetyltransferase